MAHAFDLFIAPFVILAPVFLPFVAKLGPVYRIIAGATANLIGLFLVVVIWFSNLIDWKAHYTLIFILEFVSYVLAPISLFVFAVAPLLFIGFGIFILINKNSAKVGKTKKIWLGIGVVLVGIYVMFWTTLGISDRTMGVHNENIRAGIQAYDAHDFPAAEEHFLAALKAAEDFGKGSPFTWLFGLRPSEETATHPTIKDRMLTESLDKVAEVYEARGQYEKAEPLIKRRLSIAEQRPGAPNGFGVIPMEKYAALLRKMNRESDATSLENRFKSILQARSIRQDFTKNIRAGIQAYHAHDFPAAEEHFLASLKAAEDSHLNIKDQLLTRSLDELARIMHRRLADVA